MRSLQFWDSLLLVPLLALAGCASPRNLLPEQLNALGVRNGAKYWDAESALNQSGYSCFVTGDQRQNFDCSRQAGVFPTCMLRVTFVVNNLNEVSALRAPEAACIGAP